MRNEVITDAREYVFALYDVAAAENAVDVSTRNYLGTGFFVTPKGDAITAAHVLAGRENLAAGRRLVAVVLHEGKETVCWVNQWMLLEEYDLALFTVDLAKTKCLEVSDVDVSPGSDLWTVGYPSHQVKGLGLEMRVLKGHVTAVAARLELNFSVPAGMSGAPVLDGTRVIGFATGRVRSEQVEEQTEELIQVAPGYEKIQIKTTSSILYYGIAHTFFNTKGLRISALKERTLMEFIKDQKREA